jgi:SPP1 gp7 family putative phage head morphogenesis protein
MMLLQLDPDDEDAEERERLAVERAAAERLQRAQREASDALNKLWMDGTLSPRDMAQAIEQHGGDFVAALGDAMRRVERGTQAGEIAQAQKQAVDTTVTEAMEAGVNVAFRQLERVGISLNYDLVNRFAVDWARDYSFGLNDNLNRSTGRQVNDIITQWMGEGESLDILISRLETVFGTVRATRIAATETTRAFAEGSLMGYRQSNGVVQAVAWKTAKDEIVCPICRPLHNVRGDLNGNFVHPGGISKSARFEGRTFRPPAHVSCRCTVAAIVDL